ncbi:Ig-like domain-containing protein, partial [bacterium]|nr:Ig-like domain-containing protein [bacterium]
TLIIPEDITVAATGYLTVVDLDANDVASAVDGDGNSLAISTDQTGPFRSGTHEIVWSVSDGSRTVSEIQLVKVIPLVTIAAAPVVEEGASITVEFLLSGDAADYPVTIPFSISGTAVQGEDYSIDVGDEVTVDEGTVGRFTLNLLVDEDLEGQETIEISLGEPTNAVAGLSQQQVITIVEENVAPQLSFVVSQSNALGEVVIGTTVAADGGDVRVTPLIEDPNLNDTHVLDWSDALSSLPLALVDSETQSLSFSAATMLGVYSLTATVTDSGNPPYDVSDTVSVNVIASAPVLADDEDTDGDGISDSEEGTGDSDGDNVPDYLDPITDPSILLVDNNQQALMSTISSIQLSLGVLALQQGDYDTSVSEDFLFSQGVTADMGYDYPVDVLDFVASGAESGYSYPIVYSLGENVIPENATYRKYMGDNLGWQDFVEDSANEVRSTYAEQGACPAASADNYSTGLVAGHNCVFLLIEDGGPNDVDGEANGTLVDPGGVAVKYIGVPSENSQVALDEYTLVANGSDTTTITVWAYDDQQLPLEHMQVTASMDITGVTVGDFVDRGDGRYTATITAGNISGNGPVRVVIDNGDVAVTLSSDTLTLTGVPVVKSYGGGCAVANGPSNDPFLLIILGALLLLLIRRRYMLNITTSFQC